MNPILPILPFLITRIMDDTTTNHNEVNINQKSSTENIEYNDVFDNSIYKINKNKKKKEDDKEFLTNFTLICYGIGFAIFIVAMLISDFISKLNPDQSSQSLKDLFFYKLHIVQLTAFGFLIAFIIIFLLISVIKKIKDK